MTSYQKYLRWVTLKHGEGNLKMAHHILVTHTTQELDKDLSVNIQNDNTPKKDKSINQVVKLPRETPIQWC